MKILVTGSNGFIGSHVTAALAVRGHRIRALVQPGTSRDTLAGLDVELLEADVRDLHALERATAGQEVIVHLAAVPSDWAPADLIHAVNVGGTRNLVDAALGAGCRRLVLMSSLAVHASSGHRNAGEDRPRDREDLPYALSKREAEDVVRHPRLAGRLETVVLRPGLVPFGPRDRLFSEQACRLLARGAPLPLVRGGRTAICTSYVENLAAGVALAAERPEASGQVLVLADDGHPTWADLFGALARALGVRPRFPAVPWTPVHLAAHALEIGYRTARLSAAPPLTRYRVDLMRHDFHFSSERAKELIGYAPQVGLEEGASRTVAWVRGERG